MAALLGLRLRGTRPPGLRGACPSAEMALLASACHSQGAAPQRAASLISLQSPPQPHIVTMPLSQRRGAAITAGVKPGQHFRTVSVPVKAES